MPVDDAAALEQAFARKRVPLRVLSIDDESAAAKYQHYPWVLVRPDQHIAWRSRTPPADPAALVAMLTASN